MKAGSSVAGRAKVLHSYQVSASHVVPIFSTSPLDLTISMIAILLVGAAYIILPFPKVGEIEEVLNLGEARSPVALSRERRSQLSSFSVKVIDPQELLHESYLGLSSTEVLPPCTLSPDQTAFLFSSFEDVDYIRTSHAQATERLRALFDSFKVTMTSRVLVIPNSSSRMVHGILWNVFSHGATLCVSSSESSPLSSITYSHCSHVVLDSDDALQNIKQFREQSDLSDDSACKLPILIVPDEITWDSGLFENAIQYNETTTSLKKEPEVTIQHKIEILYQSPSQALDVLEVLASIPSGQILHQTGSIITKIRDDLVVKYGCGVFHAEAAAMLFVREHTQIRVPAVHLVFRHRSMTHIVMEYVDGTSLDLSWLDLDDDRRPTVLSKVSEYIQQLRSIEYTSSHPGPIGGTVCRGPWFTLYNAGPFSTHSALVAWLNHKHKVGGGAGDGFSDAYKLVFTHQDLAPRNFMLDKDGQLWMIDWELAGWYPAYFEYACTASVRGAPSDWIDALLRMLGPFKEESSTLESITGALERLPFA
ncbi:unnamed protein product [Cyclocybe aegerita]|uniref:Aminoglycoside phosphotransferase domain-containing protein n=1 Tax=Cyclocybe aegerita TaxID=1973307 RepID=A0A8S0W429_CYCAE|nr:unnamed protein product [Cyclocybe aegerita]